MLIVTDANYIAGLTEGIGYFFRVYSENAFGLSSPLESQEAIVPTNPLLPPQPPQLVEVSLFYYCTYCISSSCSFSCIFVIYYIFTMIYYFIR